MKERIEKIKVTHNRPFYNRVMGCYAVEWSIDKEKNVRWFNDYQEGIQFLKNSFPQWFAKNYSTPPVKQTT